PVEGWARLWPGVPEQPAIAPGDDEAEARADLMRRISAAGVTTLGQVATIYAADGVRGRDADKQEPAEVDDLPWTDAARWRAERDDDGAPTEGRGLDNAAVEALFAAPTVESFGSCEDMGWCGLVRHEGQTGGAILLEN